MRSDGDDVEGDDRHPVVAKNADPAPMNRGLVLLRFSEGAAQLARQPLARHAQQVESHTTGPGLQIGAGAAPEPPYLQIGVDDDSCRA